MNSDLLYVQDFFPLTSHDNNHNHDNSRIPGGGAMELYVSWRHCLPSFKQSEILSKQTTKQVKQNKLNMTTKIIAMGGKPRLYDTHLTSKQQFR